jgi:SAM-dependent methyltransferase
VTNSLDAVRDIEHKLLQVYDYCPPTRTTFVSDEARAQYREFWGHFYASLGVPPERFAGARILDAGCGSCEKAGFYHDWGGLVTGIDLSGEVLAHGRAALGDRNVELIHGSLFDLDRPDTYDIAVIDGVSFVTADTYLALEAVTRQLKPGGTLIFSLTNVWGRFWWFGIARRITHLLGGDDFHRRAEWGTRLFLWTRGSQEGTAKTSGFHRSDESWAYDWFGPPAYHLHSPKDIQRWLATLGLSHRHSIPDVFEKQPSVTRPARLVRSLFGGGPSWMRTFWLANRAPNMVYVAAVKEGKR